VAVGVAVLGVPLPRELAERSVVRHDWQASPVVTPDTFHAFVCAYDTLPGPPWAGQLAVHDVDLPSVVGRPEVLRVVLTGGAGQLAAPVAFCARHDLALGSVDTAVRDLDDPAGNARRIVTAAGDLPDDVRLHVHVGGSLTPGWLAALDVLAEGGLPEGSDVVLPLDRVDPEPWIDAALDRELPVGLAGGTAEQAVEALRTTARLWGDADDLAAARRWCHDWLTDDGVAAAAHLGTL
jgi:hypothetical protein